jgi:hypothetical protein
VELLIEVLVVVGLNFTPTTTVKFYPKSGKSGRKSLSSRAIGSLGCYYNVRAKVNSFRNIDKV